MKRLLILACFIAFLAGCSSYNGQLIGVQDRPQFYSEAPISMVYIPAGSYMMGPDDVDVPWGYTSKQKMVTVQAIYMDDAEISNNKYRQFVFWVRDSLLHLALADADQNMTITQDKLGNEIDPPLINWNEKIPNLDDNQDMSDAAAPLFLPENERFYRRKQWDTRTFNFRYYTINLRLAAEKYNRFIPDREAPDKNGQSFIKGTGKYNVTDNPYNGTPSNTGYPARLRKGVDRSVFIDQHVVNVYPDTLCWIHDFTYSFNEPMTNMYFWHPAYDAYPVVGVSWQQATAFCVWRSELHNSYLANIGEAPINNYRLPTEAEWEYCARGGLPENQYPWGGPYIRNYRGCFLANFKPLRGSYIDDGGVQTVGVYSYNPNDYGLYCMAGNVSEWCQDAYDEDAQDYEHDLNPYYDYNASDGMDGGEPEPVVLQRKVIRGGSWKDVAYYLECGTRTYEYQDTATCYIGFRCVTTYLGRAQGDNLDNVSSAHD